MFNNISVIKLVAYTKRRPKYCNSTIKMFTFYLNIKKLVSTILIFHYKFMIYRAMA